MTLSVVATLAEAWLPAFILAAGLTAGALVVLAVGRLLGETWVAPLRPPLEAMARAAPMLLPLAMPLALPLLETPVPYPWAAPGPDAPGTGWYRADAFVLRSLAVLVLWAVLGRLLARPRVPGWQAGMAVLLLVLTGAVAMEDWALSRDRGWTGSLQGLALLVEQAGAAIALAALLAPRRRMPNGMPKGMPADAARTGLERALLTFAMATLWLWFVQYIVVYAADLPDEAAWYLRRSEGVWGRVKVGIGLPALLAAIGLALVPQWRRWRLIAVCALLLVQHLVHLAWVVRPDAALVAAASPGMAAGAATSALADALVFGLMAAVLAWAWRRAARHA